MKKKALIIASVLTIAGMTVNLLCFLSGRIMPLALTMYGGEIHIDMGFGLRATAIYQMTQNGGVSKSLVFDPISLIICLAVLYAVTYVCLLVIEKVGRKKK